MTTSRQTERSPAELQRAFDAAAPGMDLELEAPRPRRRAIGVAVVGVTSAEPPPVEVAGPEPAPEVGKDDDRAIAEIVEAWEGASAATFLEVWKRHGTHPMIVAGHDWIGTVTEGDVRRALASRETQETLEKFPCYEPRKIKVSQLRIVYQGPTKAIATFAAEEKYKNGKVFAGNSALVLLKNAAGEWRVALFSKHNRFTDFVEQTG